VASTRNAADARSRAEEQALARARRRVAARGRPAPPRAVGRTPGAPARSATLDVLRGVGVVGTVVLLAGTPPAVLPDALAPASWHGYRLGDLVLPLFLVVAGASLALAHAGRTGASAWRWRARLARRTVVLLALGLALSWLADPILAELRWTGPLQRVALASLLGWGLTRLPRWWQVAAVGAVLAGWWWVLLRAPVPGPAGDRFAPDGNLARWVDRSLLGPEHVAAPTDPLGLAATLPAALLVVAGVRLGVWLRGRPPGPATAAALAVAGGWLVVLGVVWAQVTPLNPTLMTPSYVLFATGAVLVATAVAHLAAEVLPAGRAVAPLVAPLGVLGRNPLVAYVLAAGLVAVAARPGADNTSAWGRLVEEFAAPVFGDLGAVVLAAVLLALVTWVVTRLDRRGRHLRA
jgi:predicted acyltransferase